MVFNKLFSYQKFCQTRLSNCPNSALLYVLSAEHLYHVMSSNTNIRGIKIPLSNKVALMFQHADDTTLTLSDTNSVTEVLKVFNLY